MSNIDRADWHYGGNFPGGLKEENGGTHIGIYIAWIIHRTLYSEELKDITGEALQMVLDRKMTGCNLLFKELDEKFFDSLLNDTGKAFTIDYYDNAYINDYDKILGGELPSTYHVEDNWNNFDRMAQALDYRFNEWKDGKKKWYEPNPDVQNVEESSSKFYNAIGEASRQLPDSPKEAIRILEEYISTETVKIFKKNAQKELKNIKKRYKIK